MILAVASFLPAALGACRSASGTAPASPFAVPLRPPTDVLAGSAVDPRIDTHLDPRLDPREPAHVAALHSACARALEDSPPLGILLFARRGNDHVTLFGTVHMGNRADRALTPGILCYLDAARRAAVEVDLDPGKAGEAMSAFGVERERALGRSVTHYPRGASLHATLGDRAWRELVSLLPPGALERTAATLSRLEGENVPPERLSEQTISGLANAIASNALATETGAEVANAPDFVVYERAKRAGKPLLFLETFEEQLRVLTSFDDEGAARVARRLVRTGGPSGLAAANATFYSVWKEGVTPEGASRAWETMDDDVHERMFLVRNGRMARNVARCAGPDGCFVALGFGHLIGERTVQEHLASLGFEVRRMK